MCVAVNSQALPVYERKIELPHCYASLKLLYCNVHVYFCLFVNIEIKTLGWHI